MSYTVKQFRRTQLSEGEYKSAVDYTMGTITTSSGGVDFTDVTISAEMSASNSYYLVFTVKQNSTFVQDFTLKLITSSSDYYQIIDSFSCPIGTRTKQYEIIFTPTMAYDTIKVELTRIPTDYTSPRKMAVTVSDLSLVTDIMANLGTSEIRKIGIQGKSGQLMCLNGEQIRIGKSGIYEIDNGYSITSIGFIIKKSSTSSDKLDYFVVDYQY